MSSNTALYRTGESRYTQIEARSDTVTTQAAAIQRVSSPKGIRCSLPAAASSSRALLFSSAPNPHGSSSSRGVYAPNHPLIPAVYPSQVFPQSINPPLAAQSPRNSSLILRSPQTSSDEPQIQAGDCSSNASSFASQRSLVGRCSEARRCLPSVW